MMKKSLAMLLLGLVISGCGSRTIGNKVDDQVIHPNVKTAVRQAHPDLNRPTTHLVMTSYNGIVLLAGETPSASLKPIATRAAEGVDGVKKVHNELTVGAPTPLGVRSNDSLLTSKVKAALVAETSVPSNKVKVVTVNGTVFLLGVVSRTEANNMTRTVQQVGGVQKIVRLFEYIN